MALVAWELHAKNRTFKYFNKDEQNEWDGPFYFIQGADIQFGLIKRYIEKNPTPGWSKEIELAKKAVTQINNMNPKPKFFVICGDLCDAMPEQEPKVRQQQELTFKTIFRELDRDIPLVCVCGNHDVGDQPTEDTVMAYRNSFGDDYFSFWCGGILFLVINSQYFHDDRKVPSLAKLHETWLEGELKQAKEARIGRVIVFQHIPWFLYNPDENDPSSYFSLNFQVRTKWLLKFQDAGVKAVFCGHTHRNAGGMFKDMECVVTSAIGGQLGLDEPGLRVVKVLPDGIQHTYHSLDDIPTTIQL